MNINSIVLISSIEHYISINNKDDLIIGGIFGYVKDNLYHCIDVVEYTTNNKDRDLDKLFTTCMELYKDGYIDNDKYLIGYYIFTDERSSDIMLPNSLLGFIENPVILHINSQHIIEKVYLHNNPQIIIDYKIVSDISESILIETLNSDYFRDEKNSTRRRYLNFAHSLKILIGKLNDISNDTELVSKLDFNFIDNSVNLSDELDNLNFSILANTLQLTKKAKPINKVPT